MAADKEYIFRVHVKNGIQTKIMVDKLHAYSINNFVENKPTTIHFEILIDANKS